MKNDLWDIERRTSDFGVNLFRKDFGFVCFAEKCGVFDDSKRGEVGGSATRPPELHFEGNIERDIGEDIDRQHSSKEHENKRPHTSNYLS